MLDTLITSKTRIKLLLKFFLNGSTSSHLRSLEAEFGESSNSIRLELNKFEQAGMLVSFNEGNKKLFQANSSHPLFKDLQSIVRKYVGIDRVIEQISFKLGKLSEVYLAGAFAKGIDSQVIDLIFVGKDIDTVYLVNILSKIENMISRKIRYLIFDESEFRQYLAGSKESLLLIWESQI
jgi:hypothetical protein